MLKHLNGGVMTRRLLQGWLKRWMSSLERKLVTQFDLRMLPIQWGSLLLLSCFVIFYFLSWGSWVLHRSGIWLFVGILCIKIRRCIQFCYCGCSCIVGAQFFILLALQAATMIKFLTDGVLLREIMNDPLLTKYRY